MAGSAVDIVPLYDRGDVQIVLHYAAGPGLTARLAALERDGFSVSVCPASDHARFAALLSGAVVIWHLLEPLTAAMIEAAPCLRLIQKIGVGVNTIDLDAARRRDVAVCNMPGTNSPAVAEMTLLLMLGALRRVHQLDAETRAGRGWELPVGAPGPPWGDRRPDRGSGGLWGGAAAPRPCAEEPRGTGAVHQSQRETGRGGRRLRA